VAALAAPVAAARAAVRAALAPLPAGSLVLVACSGGADSLALACCTAFVAPRLGLRAGLVSVDHGLQPGSAARAAQVVTWAGTVGLDPALAVPVRVAGRTGGPEAAARQARYEGLAAAAGTHGAAAVLLGHTRDDQAETVLLALARGGGPRGLAGMPARREWYGRTFLRPFLDLSRAGTRAVCVEAGLRPWEDPHNTDPGYARARVRAAMPHLVAALGEPVVANLARTAALVAADLAALDEVADRVTAEVTDADGVVWTAPLAVHPPAVRRRVLRRYALQRGVPGAALARVHLEALDALVCRWHGQGPVGLPGGLRVSRIDGRLVADPPMLAPVGLAFPAEIE